MGGYWATTGRGHHRIATFRFVVGALTISLILLGLATQATADDQEFEIVVPLPTHVKAPPGTEEVLNVTETPEHLVGETCSVTAQARNQSSVHPGNDLAVESASRIVLADVEATPGGVVTAADTLVLSETITITLRMGRDGVFSAGIEVRLQCPPPTTTTTTMATTTTVAATTLTTSDTTTTAAPTTTVTTTGPSSTAAPTTTIEDEILSTQVLPFTGPGETRLGLVALALGALGILLLVGAKAMVPVTVPIYVSRPARCARCGGHARFSTPHGTLCFGDTRRALHEDPELWVPTRIEEDR